MARLTVKDGQDTVLEDGAAIRDYLGGIGITYDPWPLENVDPALLAKEVWDDADKAALLAAYGGQAEELKGEGYVTADVIALHRQVPGLDGLLAKFDREHYHTDDEVRFIAAGEGVFGFTPDDGPPVELLVASGDFINVPKNTWHWFTLTDKKRIVAIRYFQDQSGWTPFYRE